MRTLGILVALLLSLTSLAAEPDFSQTGFSTVNALGINGCTGGGNLEPIVVHTAQELLIVAERRDIKDKALRENTPRVIRIANDIDLGELKNGKGGNEVKEVGIVRPASHTTLYASGAGATLRRGTIEVHGKHNVIIRNLAFRDLWEYDPSGEYDDLGWDYIRITRKGDALSHHVWVDHCDFGRAYDGQLDVVHGSDLVTISWCKFAGDENGPQKKSILIGHNPGNAEQDGGRLNVTLHHNWFENIGDRAPRARFGNIHCFNNFVNGAENATMSVVGATTLIERNYYNDVRIATTYSHADDTVQKNRGGKITIVDCVYANPRPLNASSKPSVQFEHAENFKQNVPRHAMEFNPPRDFEWPDRTKPPYSYRLDPAESVPDIVKAHAGVGKISLAP